MEKLKKLIDTKIDYESFSISTRTTREQSFFQRNLVELYINKLYQPPAALFTAEHAQFIFKMFEKLPAKFISTVNSQPCCKCGAGGFSGGVLQEPHLGCTFAATCAIMILAANLDNARELINAREIEYFLIKCKNRDGSFKISPFHETDLRAAYCAIAIFKLLNLKNFNIFENTAEYIARCQNYDGGFGGIPGAESHAGYSYCGYAALVLLGREDLADYDKLLSWAVHRQVPCVGGFQGRVNKLVDSCYSFWCGALIPLLQAHSSMPESEASLRLINKDAHDFYLLFACQNIAGGFTDRLLHNPDVYHTCYSLSSLALFHNSYFKVISEEENLLDNYHHIERVHPLYNITIPVYDLFLKHYYNQQ